MKAIDPMTMSELVEFFSGPCGNPACTNIDTAGCVKALHSRCHPESPTWVFIDPGKRMLVVECAKCSEVVVAVSLSCPS